jgi:CarboxypepD_reg-like domain/TonB-dependent Receptor Plug Domain
MKYFLSLCLLLGFSLSLFSQKITLSGRVLEASSNEALINANVFLIGESKGTQTNQYGYFSLTIPAGNHEIRFSYSGYAPFMLKKTFTKDTVLSIKLQSILLNEIIVRNENTKEDKPVGFMSIPIQQLKKIPMVLGEMDLLKALTMTPGISSGQEGSAGLNVRGSSPDQNLILLDEAPMYNTSHAFGYLSVFNPDAIKNIDVYKGGFPARFGGRLASVLDITMKEGNSQRKRGELSLGILSSRFLKEGPIKKDKSSYLVAGRFMNTLLVQLPTHFKTVAGADVDGVPSLWFYDFNAKVNHKFDNNGQLLFSFYSNYDFYKTVTQRNGNSDIAALNWGSITSSLRYNKAFSNKLFGKVSLIYSNFKYQLSGENSIKRGEQKVRNSYVLSNSIRDIGVKTSLEYAYSPSFTQRIGLEHTFHLITPGQLEITKDNVEQDVTFNQNVRIFSQESAVFIENEVSPFSFLKMNIGGRISRLSVNNAFYTNFEPRLSAKIAFTTNHGLKFGYTQMQQYLHQLTSNGIGIPNDIWVTATEKVPPSKATQADIGYYWTFGKEDNWELSVETYQKNFTQLIDYQQGSDVVSEYNVNWQDIIVKDVIGKASGLEVMIQKKQGKLNGWISYTNAVSQRQSPEINKGEWYYARYDRRHKIAIVSNYQLTPKWSFTSSFVYQTGYPVTLPEGTYMGADGYVKLYYSGRNNSRISDFHRLDIGASYHYKTKKRQRDAAWNLGIYNVYNRKNPNYLEIGGLIKGTQLSIKQQSLLPILPYFSYQVKF